MKKAYPGLKIEDVEIVVESMDHSGAGKVNIAEFVNFFKTVPKSVELNPRKFQAILALKAQRRFLPNDFMKYYEKIAESVLNAPSFVGRLHAAGKNLPSEGFRLVHDTTGVWYNDIRPIIGPEGKPLKVMQEIDPTVGGYIILNGATGVPIPSETVLKRENIVNRTVKVGFFDSKAQRIVYGTTFVQAEWEPGAEDIWSFNSPSAVGTNPIVFKWADKVSVPQIDVVFEFVSSIKFLCFLSSPTPKNRKGTKVVEVSNGWGKISLEKLALPGNYTIPLNGGTPQHPSVLEKVDIKVDRKGFFAGLKRAFGKEIKSQFKITVRGFADLLEAKKRFIRMLPGHCMGHKKLLPFVALYRDYLQDVVLSEQILQFKAVDQDPIISQFETIMDNPDVVSELIKHWDSALYLLPVFLKKL